MGNSKTLHIKSNSDQFVSINVIDVNGRLIQQIQLEHLNKSEVKLNYFLQDRPSGIYIINVYTRGSSFNKTIHLSNQKAKSVKNLIIKNN